MSLWHRKAKLDFKLIICYLLNTKKEEYFTEVWEKSEIYFSGVVKQISGGILFLKSIENCSYF